MMLITRNTCQSLLLSSLLFLPSYSFSQDTHDRSAGFAAGSSPFDAPTEDAFVADTGPGLDTGCTFNNDPEHPLVISVLVDRSVGPVDANGYLINPAAMVAKGVIPANVEIVMPAYDIDFNGSPPPERDEVLFNGESLGLLTGDNGIWKLNSFTVPISKIKFPAPSATPGSATNVVQINVDTLNVGRWCAAIDWVAINVPIRPIVALKIKPMGANTIRQNSGSATIDTIFEQSLDADCNLTDVIGPIDQYPFSAAAVPGAAKLQTELEVCPLGSMTSPEVKAEWEIASTGLTGSSTWTGLNGDVDLSMPANVGAYTVNVEYSLDDSTTTNVSRKLFVTKQAPITAGAPRLSWYEKATDWASGESTEAAILPRLLSGLYGYGNANWRYGYNFGPVTKCNWEGLAADPLTCDYADCYVFSDVFENMAKTLGIGGLGVNSPTGANGSGFVTTGAPSLDPAFPGNARSFGTAIYDRYRFSSHSLRVKGGSYFDATFNGIYPNSTAFIAYNINGPYLVDASGIYQATDEGAKIYRDPPPSVYDSWGSYQYQLPPLMRTASSQASAAAVDLTFTGVFNYQEQDTNADGLFETLSVDVEVELTAPGDYDFFAVLKKGGVTIANRPEFESMLPTQASLSAGSGTHNVNLKFSGEQIFRSGLNGPYEFEVFALSSSGHATTSNVTSAYNHENFGEIGANITAVSESRLDSNGNGKYEDIVAAVELTVRTEASYIFNVDLSGAGGSITNATKEVHLLPGTHTVSVPVSAQALRRSGVNGPYEGVVNLQDSLGHNLDSFNFTTAAYPADEFDALLLFNGGFIDSVLDTNGNGLYENLLIEFSADVAVPGAYVLSAALQQPGGVLKVFSDQAVTLVAGVQTLGIDFYGPLIQDLGIDGPYQVTAILREPTSLEILDYMVLPSLTSAYTANQFEPLDAPAAIRLTGNTRDQGIDTNGNGLYDLLEVALEVELARDDFYTWSARLVSDTGVELGFTTGSATLTAGIHEVVLNYDGLAIGNSGIDGPYSIKGLLMFGSTGPNLVAVNVADTGSYSFTQFEGSNLPPIANAGPDQNVECSDETGAKVFLDASASSDPDGDDLTYQWSGSFGNLSGVQAEVQLPLGVHMISLTVDDGRGGVATDSLMVIVEDTTAPQVSAEFVAIGERDDDEGWFELRFSCLDACSAEPMMTAELNGIPVENGQRVYLELDDEHEARYRRGRLRSLEAPSFELIVSCTDSSGNQGVTTARPLFIDDDDDDENEDD